VKAVATSNSAKMGLQMKRRFWEEDDHIFGGHLYSNLPIGEFSYPSYDYFTKKGVLLGLYSNGPVGNLLDQPVAARVEHVLTHASKVHPQIRAEYETAYCTFWEKIPYSLGAFAGGGGGGNSERLATLGKPDGRIFLGCAAVSGNGGWQEGAVAAAWKQVKQLHEMAMTRTQTA
jgi:monoamine oxidase